MISQWVERPKPKTFSQPRPSFSSLPDEIVENILARLSRWSYPSLSLVSKRFHSLLSSPQIYKTRSHIGTQERCFYATLRLPDHPNPSWFSLWTKPITEPKLEPEGEERLSFNKDPNGTSIVPTLFYSNHCPFLLPNITLEVGSDIYEIGGPEGSPSSYVRILDCRNHTWREAPNMNVARYDPCVALLDDKIYVMGGCDIDEYSANWLEVFDIKTQSWTALPGPGPDEDELQNHLRGNHSYDIVDMFQGKIYVAAKNERDYTYDTKDGSWKFAREHSSFLSDICFWYKEDHIIYGCDYSGCFVWCDLHRNEGREWKEIKGLEELCDHKDLNVKCVNDLIYYDGKILFMWDPNYKTTCTERKNKMGYVKISLETRSSPSKGREVWGKVECVDVLTFPGESYEYFRCCDVMV